MQIFVGFNKYYTCIQTLNKTVFISYYLYSI